APLRLCLHVWGIICSSTSRRGATALLGRQDACASLVAPKAGFERRLDLEHDANGNASLRIIRVEEVIVAIDVVNVNVIGVIPFHRPGIDESKPEAAVLEA